VKRIAIVDYHAGNLASVRKAFEHLGHETVITEDPDLVRRSRRLVVPGVGNFAATRHLTDTGLRDAIGEALKEGGLFLGICVGMQWMFEASTEAPGVPGLEAFHGRVEKFPSGVKSPHVGWNQIEVVAPSRLLAGVPSGAFVYYTHSYRVPVMDATVATTEYGPPFTGAVERGNLFGVQFHPEKSSQAGLRMLDNFAMLEHAA